jgi:hypothetical protein
MAWILRENGIGHTTTRSSQPEGKVEMDDLAILNFHLGNLVVLNLHATYSESRYACRLRFIACDGPSFLELFAYS